MSESESAPAPLERVKEFHETFDLAGHTEPGFPDTATELARLRFLAEGFVEYVHAVRAGDLVEIDDALTDMQYIIDGTAHVYGIDLDRTFAVIAFLILAATVHQVVESEWSERVHWTHRRV